MKGRKDRKITSIEWQQAGRDLSCLLLSAVAVIVDVVVAAVAAVAVVAVVVVVVVVVIVAAATDAFKYIFC